MDFVIVTGLSGAGKTGALHAMEDIGFFCVDNLPAKLIPFFTICACPPGRAPAGGSGHRYPGRGDVRLSV